ncbi:glycosyl hydrolase family 65 central catalytic domain-containing protein [Xylariales sp. PMI_506]|nr:glycosyl hydrolase family 65 central catalytic domain-containing protein [Xylariales sp. PMI_506]
MHSFWYPLAVLQVLRSASTVSATPDFSVTTGNLSVWDQTDWSLTATEYVPGYFQSRLALANGYVGASVAAAGPFFEIDVNETDPSGPAPTNGWPLFDARIAFSSISGFYNVQENATGTNYPWLGQYGWDSFIAGIPHPTAIIFAFGQDWLDATASNTTISNYAQKVSFKTGITEWSYTWQPAGSTVSYDVTFSTIFSRVRPNVIAVKATIQASSDVNGTATDLLDGRSAVRSYLDSKGADGDSATIYSAIHPNGLANVTGWVVSTADFPFSDGPQNATGSYISSNESTIGQTFDINLEAGKPVTFYKYVGVASTDKFPDAESVARQAAVDAKSEGWDALIEEHVSAWSELMTEDTVDNFTDPDTGALPADPNVQVLQIGSVASTFYLLQNLQPDGSGLNDNSISVGGLASDSYAGMVFWDADTWMAPGLNLAFPNYAKQIPNYRVKQHAQALANAAFNNYPNGSSLYSWTSGRYGNCTATGPCVDYEYHLNYDIAFNILQVYNLTQNETWFSSGPEQVILSTAIMTAHLLQFNETEGTYWLHNATDPDEYANNVDNPSFTIAAASELLLRANELLVAKGEPANETWAAMAQSIAFPRASSNITLEYETMNNSVEVKQADVVLLTYPLGYSTNYSTANSLLDLDYYSIKQSPDGPAMTFGVFAADANAVSPSGCAAYTYTLKAFLPYLRGPWFQFSEQQVDDYDLNGGTNPAFPFLTGHGGASQVAPYGFLGIRTDQSVLFLSPSLPPQIPHLKVRTFYYAGAAFSAVLNATHTALTRVSPVALLNSTYTEDEKIPFVVGAPGDEDASSQTSYEIAVNETIIIPNRLYWQNQTYPGNILQCLPVTSDDSYVAGQLPASGNDGAAATSWQPATNETASILIDTSSVVPRRVKGFYFDFGTRPAANATVWLYNQTVEGSNSSSSGTVTVVAVDGITPNAPTAGSGEVVPVSENTTTLALTDDLVIWTGDWVRLFIEGCIDCDASEGDMGATLSEFAIY